MFNTDDYPLSTFIYLCYWTDRQVSDASRGQAQKK